MPSSLVDTVSDVLVDTVPRVAAEPDEDDDVIIMIDPESSAYENWECPCCMHGRRRAQLIEACGHLVCFSCLGQIRDNSGVLPPRCPICRSSAEGLASSNIPLAAPPARHGMQAIVLDLTREEEDEKDAGATWPCPECTNIRMEGYACDRRECGIPRCKECWERRPSGFCAFCGQGKRSQTPLRL